MAEQLEKLLDRKLTIHEKLHIKWLLGWDKDTIVTFESLFAAIYKAGQDEVRSTF